MAGRLSGKVNFEAAGPSVESGQAKGEIKLENASLEKAKISGWPIPDVRFRDTKLTFELKNGRMDFEQFNANGDELNISASGNVSFRDPIDASVLGFSNRWYPAAIKTAQTWRIAEHDVRIVTPALFIATKLEAFRGRGGGDVFASHDLEDIVTVVDGRSEIVGEVAAADAEVRTDIASEIRSLLDNRTS